MCNSIGCIRNSNIFLISIKEKSPEFLKPATLNALSNELEVRWRAPRINGVIEKYVFILDKHDLEIEMKFSFETNSTNGRISALKNFRNQSINFSYNSIFNRNSVYSLKILDLVPLTRYRFELYCCNRMGCVLNDAGSFKTLDSELNDFRDPIVNALNKSSVIIEWTIPLEVNGILKKFILYRNHLFAAEITNMTSKLGFFSFIDRYLVPNMYYTYQVEAVNEHFSITSKTIKVKTPSENFIENCTANNIRHFGKLKKMNF